MVIEKKAMIESMHNWYGSILNEDDDSIVLEVTYINNIININYI